MQSPSGRLLSSDFEATYQDIPVDTINASNISYHTLLNRVAREKQIRGSVPSSQLRRIMQSPSGRSLPSDFSAADFSATYQDVPVDTLGITNASNISYHTLLNRVAREKQIRGSFPSSELRRPTSSSSNESDPPKRELPSTLSSDCKSSKISEGPQDNVISMLNKSRASRRRKLTVQEFASKVEKAKRVSHGNTLVTEPQKRELSSTLSSDPKSSKTSEGPQDNVISMLNKSRPSRRRKLTVQEFASKVEKAKRLSHGNTLVTEPQDKRKKHLRERRQTRLEDFAARIDAERGKIDPDTLDTEPQDKRKKSLRERRQTRLEDFAAQIDAEGSKIDQVGGVETKVSKKKGTLEDFALAVNQQIQHLTPHSQMKTPFTPTSQGPDMSKAVNQKSMTKLTRQSFRHQSGVDPLLIVSPRNVAATPTLSHNQSIPKRNSLHYLSSPKLSLVSSQIAGTFSPDRQFRVSKKSSTEPQPSTSGFQRKSQIEDDRQTTEKQRTTKKKGAKLVLAKTKPPSKLKKMPVFGKAKPLFQHYCGMPVARDAFPLVEEAEDKFLENLLSDLEAYAKHAGRKTILPEDVILLMKRQRYITKNHSLAFLVAKYLPMQYREEMIPCYRPDGTIFP